MPKVTKTYTVEMNSEEKALLQHAIGLLLEDRVTEGLDKKSLDFLSNLFVELG